MLRKLLITLVLILSTAASSFSAVHYRGFLDVSPVAYSKIYEASYYDTWDYAGYGNAASTLHGLQLSRHSFVGLGIGFTFPALKEMLVPVFASYRWDSDITKKYSFFARGDIGYNVLGKYGHFYISPTIGVRIGLSRIFGINLGVTYQFCSKGNDSFYRYGPTHYIGLSVGVDF